MLQSGDKRDAKAIVAAMGTVVFPSEPSHLLPTLGEQTAAVDRRPSFGLVVQASPRV